jgi:hypothetical protein
MLKELNRLWLRSRHQAAAWRRWYRKLPHNRIRRRRIRDETGRTIGYGPPEPVPEPVLSAAFCRKVELPSGRVELVLNDARVESAYRLARHPSPTAEAVKTLPMSEATIRELFEKYCCG